MNRENISHSPSPQALLVARNKPKPLGPWSAAVALGWRALLKIKHVPFQLFDVTVFPLMMTVMFTYLFGGALYGSPGEYLQFLLPGILVQTILFITVYTGVGLNTDIQKGIHDRFRSLPIWPSAPIFGALLGDVLRYTLASVVVLALGFSMGFRPQGGLIGVLVAVCFIQMFAFSLVWIWVIVGLKVKSPESVMTTSFLFLFPLNFASSVFIDPKTMPVWIQHLVYLNPVTHLADASRGFMHGEPDTNAITWVLISTIVVTMIFAPWALKLYHKER